MSSQFAVLSLRGRSRWDYLLHHQLPLLKCNTIRVSLDPTQKKEQKPSPLLHSHTASVPLSTSCLIKITQLHTIRFFLPSHFQVPSAVPKNNLSFASQASCSPRLSVVLPCASRCCGRGLWSLAWGSLHRGRRMEWQLINPPGGFVVPAVRSPYSHHYHYMLPLLKVDGGVHPVLSRTRITLGLMSNRHPTHTPSNISYT